MSIVKFKNSSYIKGPKGDKGDKGDTGDSGIATTTGRITYNPSTKTVGFNDTGLATQEYVDYATNSIITSYNDLTDTPTRLSDFINDLNLDGGQITFEGDYEGTTVGNDLIGNITIDGGEIVFTGNSIGYSNSVIPSLAEVATSGSYNDLNDKPSLLYRQVNVPTTSKGQPGDQLNDIAFDNLYIYYCVAYYNDGVADIWKRVAFSPDTWSF